jgi:signal-transduction protein with cAMP-binding, CBS, and nucleotidyltransferase domain
MSPLNWPRNRLLLALPAGNLKRLMSQLEPIPCERGQVLLDADSALDNVFFPDSGVVSVVAVYEDGSVIEMATIGREGCTGFQAIFGDRESSVRFLVQIPRKCCEDVAQRVPKSHESDAGLPQFDARLCASLHGASAGVGGMQRRA